MAGRDARAAVDDTARKKRERCAVGPSAKYRVALSAEQDLESAVARAVVPRGGTCCWAFVRYFDTIYKRLYDPRPMSNGLPATIDAIQLADTGARLAGEIPVRAMARLRALCLDAQGKATIDLYFERGGKRGLRRVRGTITASIRVACQRCLEPMTLAIEAQPSLVVVPADERSALPAQEADVLVADKPVSLNGLVEDELLLAMPMIPMHELRECPATASLQTQQRQSRASPFAVLDKLKQRQK